MPRYTRRGSSEPKIPAGMAGELIQSMGQWASNWRTLTYNPSNLVGKQGLKVFDLMMMEDQIKAALNFKRDALLASGWEVVSPEGKEEDWEVTQFVHRRLTAMKPSLEESLRRVLSAMQYGYSITEKMFEVIETGEDAGYVTITELKTKSPHYLRFKLDEFANILAIVNDHDGKEYPPNAKFILFAYGDQLNNPYGESDLEAAYRPWILASNTYKWMGQYLERLGVPPWFALYNPQGLNAAQQNELKRILTNAQNATAAAIPRTGKDDLEIWTPPNTGNVQVVFVPAIEMLKKDMARALLMPGFLGITPDNLGSYARARVTFDVFMLHLAYVQAKVAGTVVRDQIVKPLVDINFATGGVYPEFRFMPLTQENTDQIAKTWGELVDRDIVGTEVDDEDYLRSLMGFPRRGFVEDSEEENKRIPFRYLEKMQAAFTVNEVRASLGFEPIKGGDIPMSKASTPPQLDPGGQEGQEDEDGPGGGGNAPGGPQGGQGGPAGEQEEDEEDDQEEDATKRRRNAAGGTVVRGLEARAPIPFEDPDPGSVNADNFDVEEYPAPPASDDPNLTPAEQRADFAQIIDALESLEQDTTATMAKVLEQTVRALLAKLETRRLTASAVAKLKVVFPPRVRRLALASVRKALRQGRADCREEVARREPQRFAGKKKAPAPTYDPKDAMEYLDGKADFWVTGMGQHVADLVKAELLFGLKNGLPFTETRNRVLDAIGPWIGTPEVQGDAGRPDRLLTTVRTNITDAYNHGRLVQGRTLAESGLVKAMQYSAVLDRRTTPICRHLHGKVFRIEDGQLDRYTPPNHFRCRSILLPVTLDIDIPTDPSAPFHYATPEDLAEAQRLAPGGFGGSYRAGPRPRTAPQPPAPSPTPEPEQELDPDDPEVWRKTPKRWTSILHKDRITDEEAAWHDTSWGTLEERDPDLFKAVKFTPQLGAVLDTDKAHPHYQGLAIHIEVDKLDRYTGDAQAMWRHEVGHLIDHAAGERLSPGTGYSYVSFLATKEMSADAKRILAAKAPKNFKAWTEMVQAKKASYMALDADQRITKVASEFTELRRQLGLGLADLKPVQDEFERFGEFEGKWAALRVALAIQGGAAHVVVDAFNMARMSGRVGDTPTVMLADFLGALTVNQVGWGHATEYYQTNGLAAHGSKVYAMQTKEAFANWIAHRGGQGMGWSAARIMQALAPKTVDKFDALLRNYVEAQEEKFRGALRGRP